MESDTRGTAVVRISTITVERSLLPGPLPSSVETGGGGLESPPPFSRDCSASYAAGPMSYTRSARGSLGSSPRGLLPDLLPLALLLLLLLLPASSTLDSLAPPAPAVAAAAPPVTVTLAGTWGLRELITGLRAMAGLIDRSVNGVSFHSDTTFFSCDCFSLRRACRERLDSPPACEPCVSDDESTGSMPCLVKFTARGSNDSLSRTGREVKGTCTISAGTTSPPSQSQRR